MIELTQEQGILAKQIEEWYGKRVMGNDPRPFFKMGGVAGTGKTTMLKFVVEMLGFQIGSPYIAFAAYTGKAANVMQKSGLIGASTIHRLLYLPKEIEVMDPTTKKIRHEIVFEKQASLDPDLRLILVDEASMVDEEIHNDLLSYGVPILYSGDFRQLSPISGSFNLMEEKKLDGKLSEVHRQAKENPIIRISMDIRAGKDIKRGKIGDCFLKDYSNKIDSSSYLNADQIICGKNDTRRDINEYTRKLLGLKGIPKRSDRLIILRNNYDLGVFNGQQVRLLDELSILPTDNLAFASCLIEEEFYDEKLLRYDAVNKKDKDQALEINITEFLASIDDTPDVNSSEIKYLNLSKRNFSKIPYEITKDEFKTRVFADFGYAITCHKSQGSSWKKVLFVDDGFGWRDRDMRMRFIYTAITRASEKLIWAVE